MAAGAICSPLTPGLQNLLCWMVGFFKLLRYFSDLAYLCFAEKFRQCTSAVCFCWFLLFASCQPFTHSFEPWTNSWDAFLGFIIAASSSEKHIYSLFKVPLWKRLNGFFVLLLPLTKWHSCTSWLLLPHPSPKDFARGCYNFSVYMRNQQYKTNSLALYSSHRMASIAEFWHIHSHFT